jgi:hypothetical protein
VATLALALFLFDAWLKHRPLHVVAPQNAILWTSIGIAPRPPEILPTIYIEPAFDDSLVLPRANPPVPGWTDSIILELDSGAVSWIPLFLVSIGDDYAVALSPEGGAVFFQPGLLGMVSNPLAFWTAWRNQGQGPGAPFTYALFASADFLNSGRDS